MTTYDAGLRLRFIRDSLFYMVRESMEAAGWFENEPRRAPVELLPEPVDGSVEIVPNKVAMSTDDTTTLEWELGTDMEQLRWDVYFDVFAENESVGIHIVGDIVAILKGKMPSVGRTSSSFDVYDFRDMDEGPIFKCDLEEIDSSRVDPTTNFNKFYWVIGCQIVDYHVTGGEG